MNEPTTYSGGVRFLRLDQPPLATATGRGIRVAVIDSGVHAEHPHVVGAGGVGGVAGGVGIGAGGEHGDFVDRLGHGTAVAAAILEKSPEVELWVVKVFDRSLSAPAAVLVQAIDWAAGRDVNLINLSLGTDAAEHEEALRAAVQRAAARGALVVSAAESDGTRWLPGSLPETIGVGLDWDCPRDALRLEVSPGAGAPGVEGSPAPSFDGPAILASGYPRPIPDVDPERNLKGISFAVANTTGILARALEAATQEPTAAQDHSVDRLLAVLASLALPAD